MLPELSFNIDHGYLEGLVRGFKSGILRQADYLNLVQCETLEGKRNTGLLTNLGNFFTDATGRAIRSDDKYDRND